MSGNRALYRADIGASDVIDPDGVHMDATGPDGEICDTHNAWRILNLAFPGKVRCVELLDPGEYAVVLQDGPDGETEAEVTLPEGIPAFVTVTPHTP